MGEFDDIKIKPEDNPFAGLKVRAEDNPLLTPKHKYPQPKERSDEELGLSRLPMQERLRSLGFIHLLPPTWEAYVNSDSPQDKIARDQDTKQRAKEMFAMLGGEIAGSAATPLLGEITAPAFGRAAVKSVATAPNALSQFAKGAVSKPFEQRVADALGKTVEHSIAARAIQFALPGSVSVGKSAATAVAKGAVKGIPAAAPAASTAAGAALSVPAEETEPKKFRGVMSNAIERLRAQPASNVRAQELLRRFDAIQNAGTGEVNQTTLGAE